MKIFSFKAIKNKERREVVAEQIKKRSEPNAFFYSMIALSAIIVTLGLILDSAAIVIGAMLIAPFLYPLLALSLSATKGSIRLFKKALVTIISAVTVTIFLAFLTSAIVPISETGKEIFLRSSPNLIHLIVALAAGFVGALCVLWPKQGSALAGALVAAALVPPLGVLGFALANTEPLLAWGSFLLFITNLVAIIFTGIVTLFLIGFHPAHREESEKLFKENFIWSIILLLLVAIPLTWSLFKSVQKEGRETMLKNTVKEIVSSEAALENVVFLEDKDKIVVEATIFSPKLTDNIGKVKIENQLESQFMKRVELNIKQIEIKKL